MFVDLVKKNKFIILFLFLCFNCLFNSSLKANPTFIDGTVVDDRGGDDNTAAEQFTSGLSFNNDGTKMYIVGTFSDDVHEFTLTTPFDISTRTYDAGDSYDLDNKSGTPTSVKFNNDGTKMYMLGFSQDIHEYSLPAFDVSEASFEQSKTLTEITNLKPKDLEFNSDGTKMFIFDTSNIYVYTLSTAFDISTASHDDTVSVSDFEDEATGFAFSDDGTVMFTLGRKDKKVNEFYLSTGFDLTTASHVSSFDIEPKDTHPKGIGFNDDGSKMFFLGNENDSVYEYTLVSNYKIGRAHV